MLHMKGDEGIVILFYEAGSIFSNARRFAGQICR